MHSTHLGIDYAAVLIRALTRVCMVATAFRQAKRWEHGKKDARSRTKAGKNGNRTAPSEGGKTDAGLLRPRTGEEKESSGKCTFETWGQCCFSLIIKRVAEKPRHHWAQDRFGTGDVAQGERHFCTPFQHVEKRWLQRDQMPRQVAARILFTAQFAIAMGSTASHHWRRKKKKKPHREG